jgi:orotate phosphoribosyltransferase
MHDYQREFLQSQGDQGSWGRGWYSGKPLEGRVLILDDVISAGTSVREPVAIIQAHGATPAGVVIALDRQERGPNARSALAQVETDWGLAVAAILRLEHLLEYLSGLPDSAADLERLRAYQERYGAGGGVLDLSAP